MMKKIILIIIAISLSCIWAKPNKRLLGKTVAIKQDPYSSEEIYKIKELYDAGNHSALDALIKIYQDKEQTYSIRILCLDMLAKIEENGTNPLIKDAIQSTLENTDFIELEYLKKSITILQNYKDPEATKSLVAGLANSENKIMDLRETIIRSIETNGTNDEILTLIDLYEVSMSNHARMNELLTFTLGNMDDDRSIPLLMDIANNQNINIRIRNTAVELLSRKNAPELVDYFVEMLGDPETNEEMLGFINNAMGDIQNDRLTIALLESFQTGKNRYYANLHSVMSALSDYNNPQIKPAFIEIATTDGFPRLLRIKAIQGLVKFGDSSVLDFIVPILENPDNYDYYLDILSLAKQLNASENYMNLIRQAAHTAMSNTQGINN
tara:strand:- start:79774 stop:80919 length:1146 start_codon:yes stop_codon:yes gene_type:complete